VNEAKAVPGLDDVSTEDVMRWYASLEFEEGTGCWLWRGALDGDGYGRFSLGGVKYRAHRCAWRWLRGELAPEDTIDHLDPPGRAGRRLCVSPIHLRVCSMVENVMAGHGPTALNARKARCVRGHPFDRIRPDGGRRCSACQRDRDRDRYAAMTPEQRGRYHKRHSAARRAARQIAHVGRPNPGSPRQPTPEPSGPPWTALSLWSDI